MPRVKRSVHGRKKRREILAQAKGYYGARSRRYRVRPREIKARHLLEYCPHARLHGMIGHDVAARRLALMPGRREEAGVLARAVVVERRGCFAGADQGLGGGPVARRMSAAFEILWPEIGARQPSPHGPDMDGLPAVGRAG